MGTRSLVNIFEGDKTENLPLVTVYRQYDGYPTGRGKDIFNALNKGVVRITNGIAGGDKGNRMPASFNGMQELAAWYVGNEKITQGDNGNVYIMRPGITDVGEEYVYNLYMKSNPEASFSTPQGELMLQVVGGYSDKVLFDGLLSDFDPEAAEKIASGEDEDAA